MSKTDAHFHKGHRKTATWSSKGELSGTMGVKWTCDTCGFEQVSIKGEDPNAKAVEQEESK